MLHVCLKASNERLYKIAILGGMFSWEIIGVLVDIKKNLLLQILRLVLMIFCPFWKFLPILFYFWGVLEKLFIFYKSLKKAAHGEKEHFL